MAIHGKNTGLVVGPYDVTRFCKEVSSDMSVEVAETTCFDEPEGAKTYTLGLSDATFAFSGRESGTVDSLKNQVGLATASELSSPFTVGVDRGFHVGRVAVMGQIFSTKVAFSSPIADVVDVSGDLQSDGPVGNGLVLSKKTEYTTTGVEASVDQLTGSSLGVIMHYHVVQNSRNGNVDVKIQHSANNSTWVDYDTFTVAGGALNSVRRVSATAIDRYVRLSMTLGGSTGTATVRVAIAKRG